MRRVFVGCGNGRQHNRCWDDIHREVIAWYEWRVEQNSSV